LLLFSRRFFGIGAQCRPSYSLFAQQGTRIDPIGPIRSVFEQILVVWRELGAYSRSKASRTADRFSTATPFSMTG
jgi:hypothetical protein